MTGSDATSKLFSRINSLLSHITISSRGFPLNLTSTTGIIDHGNFSLTNFVIVMRLTNPLQARLVVARPKSAKEAWDLITDIVKDNKIPRTAALKVELRSIKLGDLTMEAFFTEIESIVTILAILDSPVNDEDVFHYALKGLSDKYNQVCGIMHHKDTFPDLKTALKSWRSCFNFAKGSCHFGDDCKFVHDHNAKSGVSSGSKLKDNTTDDLLVKLLHKLGLNDSTNTTGSSKGANNSS
ncbi:ribonuclease H-like domain-containing protein [Tanacetum coccineum]